MNINAETISPISTISQASEISDDDLFLISKKNDDSSYSSRKLDFGTLKSSLSEVSSLDEVPNSVSNRRQTWNSNMFQLGETFSLPLTDASYEVVSDGMLATTRFSAVCINDINCSRHNCYDNYTIPSTNTEDDKEQTYYRYAVRIGDVINIKYNASASHNLSYFVDGDIMELSGDGAKVYEYKIGDLYDWAYAGTLSEKISSTLMTNPGIWIWSKPDSKASDPYVAAMWWHSDPVFHYEKNELLQYSIPALTANIYNVETGKKTRYYCAQDYFQKKVTKYEKNGHKMPWGWPIFTPYGHKNYYYTRLEEIADVKVKFTVLKKYVQL